MALAPHRIGLRGEMALRSRFALFVGVVALVAGSVASASAQSVTLGWDANPEPDVAGYNLYYGTRSGQYTSIVNVGKVTQYKVTGLDPSSNYYFAVQAYDSAGLTSSLSSEIEFPAPTPPATTVINSFQASASFPLLAGQTVTWTASATSQAGPVEYEFWLYGAKTGWVQAQGYSANQTFTWTPGWGDVGAHYVQVWARAVGSAAQYEAWVGTPSFQVNTVPLSLSADADFPVPPGQPVQWTATLSGLPSGTNVEYKFWVYRAASGWTMLRDYAASNTATWVPSVSDAYSIQVWVRRQGVTASYETYASAGPVTVAVDAARRDPAEFGSHACPCSTGDALTWTARTRGGSAGPIQYEFWLNRPGSGWTNVQPYSNSKTFTFTPTWGDGGLYAIQVWARSAGSTANYEAWLGVDLRDHAGRTAVDDPDAVPGGAGHLDRVDCRRGGQQRVDRVLVLAVFAIDRNVGQRAAVRRQHDIHVDADHERYLRRPGLGEASGLHRDLRGVEGHVVPRDFELAGQSRVADAERGAAVHQRHANRVDRKRHGGHVRAASV